jgi:hypothetical protein
VTFPSKQKKHPTGTAIETGFPPPLGVALIEVLGEKENRKLLGLGRVFGKGIDLRLASFHS